MSWLISPFTLLPQLERWNASSACRGALRKDGDIAGSKITNLKHVNQASSILKLQHCHEMCYRFMCLLLNVCVLLLLLYMCSFQYRRHNNQIFISKIISITFSLWFTHVQDKVVILNYPSSIRNGHALMIDILLMAYDYPNQVHREFCDPSDW